MGRLSWKVSKRFDVGAYRSEKALTRENLCFSQWSKTDGSCPRRRFKFTRKYSISGWTITFSRSFSTSQVFWHLHLLGDKSERKNTLEKKKCRFTFQYTGSCCRSKSGIWELFYSGTDTCNNKIVTKVLSKKLETKVDNRLRLPDNVVIPQLNTIANPLWSSWTESSRWS